MTALVRTRRLAHPHRRPRLRRPHPHAGDGHPPRLRPLPAADSADLHWGRETFALAIAVQNLVWGATQPFAGMIADKYGTATRRARRARCSTCSGSSRWRIATTPLALVLTCGVLIGIGPVGVTFSVISGVLGRAYPPEKRSMALGISAAAGSFGQFAMLPLTQWLLSHVGWYGALLALAGDRAR